MMLNQAEEQQVADRLWKLEVLFFFKYMGEVLKMYIWGEGMRICYSLWRGRCQFWAQVYRAKLTACTHNLFP